MGILDWGKTNLKHINKLERQIALLQDSLLRTESLLQSANDRIRTLSSQQNDSDVAWDSLRTLSNKNDAAHQAIRISCHTLLDSQQQAIDKARKELTQHD